MIKLTKTQENKLRCLCSLCNHDCLSKGCLDNKILAAKEPGEELRRQFMLLLNEVVLKNKSGTRAKIKKKKGKVNGTAKK